MAVFKHLNNWTGEDTSFIEKIRHESNAGGGVSSYDELTDKPSINNVILQGNTTLDDLNIQAKGDYALKEEIPTKIGELENDLGYVTEVPTKISELENDANYITTLPEDLATISDVENMIKDKADKDALDEVQRHADSIAQTLVAKSDKVDAVEIDVDKTDDQWYSAKAIDGMGIEFGEALEGLQQQIDAMPGEEELQAFGSGLTNMIANKADKTEVVALVDTKLDKSKHIAVDVNDFDLSERHDDDAWYNANMCNEIFAKFDEMLKEVDREIPSNISELYNDKGYATTADVNTAVAKLVGSAPETLDTIEELAAGLTTNKSMVELLNDSIVDKANKADLHTVATSGDYNDLANLPTIPSIDGLVTEDQVQAMIDSLGTVHGEKQILTFTNTTEHRLEDTKNAALFQFTQNELKPAMEKYGASNIILIISSLHSGDDKELLGMYLWNERSQYYAQVVEELRISLNSNTHHWAVPTWHSLSMTDTYACIGKPIQPPYIEFFDLDYNYSNPYMPLYDGSPATKKYVDEEVAKVTFSGNYNDLTDKPTTLGQFVNDVGYLTEIPDGYATKDEVAEALNEKADKSDIPDVSEMLTQSQADAAVRDAKNYTDERIADLIDSAPDTMDTLGEIAEILGNNNDVTVALMETIGTKANKSDLATVATSGSYNDLSDTPEIPTIPADISSFTNDSGYITATPEVDVISNKSIYLTNVGTSVNQAGTSRLYFGPVDKPYSWLASNNGGAFSFSRGSGNISIYAKCAQYNCIMSDCDSDLGRTDKPWKDLYLRQNISNGTDSVSVNDLIAAVNTIATLQETIATLEARVAALEANHIPEEEVVE